LGRRWREIRECGHRSAARDGKNAGLGNGRFKIEMVVVAASGVEGSLAGGAAGVALQVLGDGEFGVAGSAEDGRLVPFGIGPDLGGMPGEGNMAILAGVIEAAAPHLDGDDVGGAVVVEAAGLGIEVQSADVWRFCGHGELYSFCGAALSRKGILVAIWMRNNRQPAGSWPLHDISCPSRANGRLEAARRSELRRGEGGGPSRLRVNKPPHSKSEIREWLALCRRPRRKPRR